jgi:hypothetical protein
MAPRDDSPGLGLGLPLIRHLADQFDHRSPPNGVGTELWMRFTLVDPSGQERRRDGLPRSGTSRRTRDTADDSQST